MKFAKSLQIGSIINNTSRNIFLLLGGLSSLLIITINFCALQFNLIPSDEGWYICLLRDMPVFGGTRFHLLFGDILTDNIYLNRVICLLFRIFGTVVFSIGFGAYLNTQTGISNKRAIAASFIAVWIGHAGISACPSFNYINTNCALAEISFGLLFLGIFRKHYLYILLSGFAAFAIVPVMATNAVLILLMVLFVFFLSRNKWTGCLSFLMGGLLFVGFYLSIIESPQDIWNFLVSESQKATTDFSGAYNVFFFVKWSIKSFLYLSRCFLIALLLYYANKFINNSKYSQNHYFSFEAVKVLILSSILIFSLMYMPFRVPFIRFGRILWVYDIMWIAAFLLAQYDYHINKWDMSKTAVVLLMASAPFLLSLGTNVDFCVRAPSYYSFILPIFLLLSVDVLIKSRMVFNAILILKMLNFIFVCFGNNWAGDSFFSNDKVPVTAIGIEQNLKLDSHYIERLKGCRSVVPDGAPVLCSPTHWLDAALSNYKPISYEFDIGRFETDFIQRMIKDYLLYHNEDLWILSTEGNDYLNKCVETLESPSLIVDKYVNGSMNYYRVTKLNDCNPDVIKSAGI